MQITGETRFPLQLPAEDLATEKPWEVFATWYAAAAKTKLKEPTAVCLATATPTGAPSCRMVLLKEHGENGFVIYTNSQSHKGREMLANPQAALCFYWPDLGQQVRIEGQVTQVSDAEADAYFATRPLNSRIGAWASQQSLPMQSKSELLKRVAYYTAQWAIGQVTRPPHWTGFRLVPDYFEFWTEGAYRIHDRKVFFQRDNQWYTALLQP